MEKPRSNSVEWDGTVFELKMPTNGTFDEYRRLFDRSYYVTRQPLTLIIAPGQYLGAGVYIDWSESDVVFQNKSECYLPNFVEVRRFIAYALSQKNVWFVTMRELVDYMRDPVDAKEYLCRRMRRAEREGIKQVLTDEQFVANLRLYREPFGCNETYWKLLQKEKVLNAENNVCSDWYKDERCFKQPFEFAREPYRCPTRSVSARSFFRYAINMYVI